MEIYNDSVKGLEFPKKEEKKIGKFYLQTLFNLKFRLQPRR